MIAYITNEQHKLRQKNISFGTVKNAEMQLIKVYPEIKGQKISGFGGALTEAAAWTFSKMPEAIQEKFLELYFGKDGSGYNLCRTHIQSCDFALGNYAYVNDADDKALDTYQIERDLEYILPLIKQVQKKTPDMTFLASPWSPPPFMKDNGQMNGGGKLLKEFGQMWADMMVRYVQEYEKLGVKISYITVQNEPQAVQPWDSCIYTAEEETEFVLNHLKPALVKAGYADVKVHVWDHNKDCIIERVSGSLATQEAQEAIDGIAFHWYSGDHFEALAHVHRMFPNKELIFTEGCVEYSKYSDRTDVCKAEMYAHDMIGDLNAGANGIIDWNVLLDERGGPNHVENYCDAPVMYDTVSGELDVKESYYYIAHFSKFIKKGATQLLTTRYTDQLECTAFENPDGQIVMVVLNKTDLAQEFILSVRGEFAPVEVQGHSIMTLCI